MAKLLLLIFFVAIVYWVFSTSVRRNAKSSKLDLPKAADEAKMLKCASCGVYFPLTDGVRVQDRDYCSVEHSRLGAPD